MTLQGEKAASISITDHNTINTFIHIRIIIIEGQRKKMKEEMGKQESKYRRKMCETGR